MVGCATLAALPNAHSKFLHKGTMVLSVKV